jgi:hypothetical protein
MDFELLLSFSFHESGGMQAYPHHDKLILDGQQLWSQDWVNGACEGLPAAL